jgi:hypothetical protein
MKNNTIMYIMAACFYLPCLPCCCLALLHLHLHCSTVHSGIMTVKLLGKINYEIWSGRSSVMMCHKKYFLNARLFHSVSRLFVC